MSLAAFHPACAAWFRETLGDPTDVQARAWPLIHQRQPVLIAAPTGSGKTLAAFFSIIDELVKQRLEAPLSDELHIL
jgi:ATP-dependent Lhr-like helicase